MVQTKVIAVMVVSRGLIRFQFAVGLRRLVDGLDVVARGSTG